MNDTITAVPGIEVGHWADLEALTGCTVVNLPEPNVVAVEVRGAAPGSRETALLQPGMSVDQVQALVLSGGSAFGLAAADGVVKALETDGRGFDTPVGKVPIVPAAVVYDLFLGDATVRPGPGEGEAAYRARSPEPTEEGLVGAGTGTTVSLWRGLEHMRPGGLGSAIREVGGATVGALAVVNAAGDVFSVSGEALTGGDHEPGPPRFTFDSGINTTLVVVATNAFLTRDQLTRLAVRAHDAMAVCIRPTHTGLDGDIVFAVSCGEVAGETDSLAEGAFGATADAIERAVRATTG